jgi:hypothetical protein
MTISASNFLFTLALGCAFANTAGNVIPAATGKITTGHGRTTVTKKTVEMAKKKSNGSPGTKKSRRPRKSSTQS